MMKKLLYMALAVFTFASCSDDLTDLNVNVKDPAIVPAGSLIANSTQSMFNYMTSPNVNLNTFRLWSQQWTQTTYTDEANYDLVGRNINGGAWNRLYATVLRDLDDARKFVEASTTLTETQKTNQSAIITINEVLAYTTLVDMFGDVPYSAALGDDITPAYDDDAGIYNELITRLNGAIEALGGETGLSDYDLIYSGDAAAWKKFANSLKLRMAIRIADVDNAKAATMAAEAYASGVFESSEDNFQLTFLSSIYTNPLWDQLVESGRLDFIASNTIADYMNDLEDPRRPYYFKNLAGDGSVMGANFGEPSVFAQFSQPGEILEIVDRPGVILDIVQVNFLLADAKERGYDVGAASAEDYYNMAITESIKYWSGGNVDPATYLANPDVAYSTAPGTWKEKIGMQKWLAMYNQGHEAYASLRQYDAPTMNVAFSAGTTPPNRYSYPSSEYSLNGESVQAAGSSMGGDNPMSKIFWDVN